MDCNNEKMCLKQIIIIVFAATVCSACMSLSNTTPNDIRNTMVSGGSGRAREGGYNGHYTMPSTSINLTQNEKCKLASQGILMIDAASKLNCSKVQNTEIPSMHHHHN